MTATASSQPRATSGSDVGAVVALPRLGMIDYAISGIIGVGAFLLYFNTLAPGLLGGDSGEFQFAAWLGGFAHPTGYPLYLLLGYLWTHLVPVGDPAWRMNLFSAVWGGVAVAIVYLLAMQTVRIAATPPGLPVWTLRMISAFAASLFAVTPTFWSQAVITEVYTMHAALVAAILLGLVTWQARGANPDDYRILYLTAFAFGLGLAHHRSTVLLLPAIIIFLWQSRAVSGSWRVKLAGLMRGLILVALPSLLYALIPLRGAQMPYADVVVAPDQVLQLYRPTLRWFVQHVTGAGFSAALGSPAQPLDQLKQSLLWLVDEVSWPGVLLGVAGIIWLFRRARTLLTLTGVAFLALFGFNLFYGIGDIRVFYISTYLIWIVWAAAGLSAVAWVLLCRASSTAFWRALAALICCAMFALPVGLLLQHFEQVDQRHNNRLALFWQGILDYPIPQGAILISNDRDEMTPLWYLQYVNNLRPDITGLFPLIDGGPGWANVGQVLDSARRSGRPVFSIKPMEGLEVKFRTETAGPLVAITGPAVTRPPDKARIVSYDDAVRLTGYDLKPTLAAPGQPMTVNLYWQPQRHIPGELTTFVHLVNADGDVVGQSDHRPGGDFYPTSLWQPGELLKDVHTLNLEQDLGQPPYALEVGLYDLRPDLVHLGQPQVVGYLGEARPSDALPEDLVEGQGFTLSNEVVLLGHTVSQEEDTINLQLFWQALRVPDRDYTVFFHIVNEAGEIVAQEDRQPASGQLPTGSWPAGQVVADELVVRLPGNLPEGEYRLLAGMYDVLSGARLPVFDAAGRPAGDSMLLGRFVWPSDS